MDVYEHLRQMAPRISARDWADLEFTYRAVCARLCGPGTADRIAKIELGGYVDALASGLSRSLLRAQALGAKAVHFEFDLEEGWKGEFLLCRRYTSGSESWIENAAEELPGPDCPELARVFEAYGFDDSSASTGALVYLLARTAGAVGQAFDAIPAPGELAVCFGFKDQNPLFRLQEPS